jgi:hypothetical protein
VFNLSSKDFKKVLGAPVLSMLSTFFQKTFQVQFEFSSEMNSGQTVKLFRTSKEFLFLPRCLPCCLFFGRRRRRRRAVSVICCPACCTLAREFMPAQEFAFGAFASGILDFSGCSFQIEVMAASCMQDDEVFLSHLPSRFARARLCRIR